MGLLRGTRFPPPELHRLRPERSLLTRGAAASIAFLVPATVVMYVLTVPNGPWVYVLVTELIILAALATAVIFYSRAGIWINTHTIAERGFFGRVVVVPKTEIGSIMLVQTYESDGSDSLPQLFVCDDAGKQLIRMRGQYWSRKKMDEVSKILRIPAKKLTDPITSHELLEEYPGLLYWFERHPRLFAALFISIIAVGGIVLYLLITAAKAFGM